MYTLYCYGCGGSYDRSEIEVIDGNCYCDACYANEMQKQAYNTDTDDNNQTSLGLELVV